MPFNLIGYFPYQIPQISTAFNPPPHVQIILKCIILPHYACPFHFFNLGSTHPSLATHAPPQLVAEEQTCTVCDSVSLSVAYFSAFH